MIRINLLPVKQLEAEVSRRRDITVGAVVLGILLLTLGAVHIWQSLHLSGLKTELEQARSELQALNTKIKEIGDLQNKIKEAKGKNNLIDDLKKKKSGPVLVMENLARATPATLWLTALTESNGSLTLTGLAVDNKTVADFLKGLEASHHFKNVELVETTEGVGPTAGFKKFAIKTAVLYRAPDARPPDNKNAPATGKKEENKG